MRRRYEDERDEPIEVDCPECGRAGCRCYKEKMEICPYCKTGGGKHDPLAKCPYDGAEIW